MKKGILITLLSALAGGLTAYAVVRGTVLENGTVDQQVSSNGSLFRTVNLSHDNWPDFTYAAESAVDAVVYVKVTSTSGAQQQVPNSIFDFFFGYRKYIFGLACGVFCAVCKLIKCACGFVRSGLYLIGIHNVGET